MRFTIYIQADNEKGALAVYNDCMGEIKNYITEQLDFIIEPYWKFPDSYKVVVEFKWIIDQKQYEHFLDNICNSWRVERMPNEMMASSTSNNTRFIKDKVELFIINMEEDERWLIPEEFSEIIPGYDDYYENGEWCHRHR